MKFDLQQVNKSSIVEHKLCTVSIDIDVDNVKLLNTFCLKIKSIKDFRIWILCKAIDEVFASNPTIRKKTSNK